MGRCHVTDLLAKAAYLFIESAAAGDDAHAEKYLRVVFAAAEGMLEKHWGPALDRVAAALAEEAEARAEVKQ